MTRFEIELTFQLPKGETRDNYELSDAVYEAGFDDAVVGTGNPEYVAIVFDDKGIDENSVIKKAENKLLKYLPKGSTLIAEHAQVISRAKSEKTDHFC